MSLVTHTVEVYLGRFPGLPNPAKFSRRANDVLGAFRVARGIVQFLNRVFSRSTSRRFSLGLVRPGIPEEDLPLNASTMDYPEKFKVRIYLVPGAARAIQLTDQGDGVVAVRWPLEPNDHRVLCMITHEVGHCFGVAIGEYEKSYQVVDLTPIQPPRLKVSASLPGDDYWHAPAHRAWLDDPMLVHAPAFPRFCWLSSRVIECGRWRKPPGAPLPDMSKVPLDVQPVGARIVIWSGAGVQKQQLDQVVGESGRVILDWQRNPIDALNADQFRIIKVFPSGQSLSPFARGLSIWDVQEAFLRYGENYSIVIQP